MEGQITNIVIAMSVILAILVAISMVFAIALFGFSKRMSDMCERLSALEKQVSQYKDRVDPRFMNIIQVDGDRKIH